MVLASITVLIRGTVLEECLRFRIAYSKQTHNVWVLRQALQRMYAPLGYKMNMLHNINASPTCRPHVIFWVKERMPEAGRKDLVGA